MTLTRLDTPFQRDMDTLLDRGEVRAYFYDGPDGTAKEQLETWRKAVRRWARRAGSKIHTFAFEIGNAQGGIALIPNFYDTLSPERQAEYDAEMRALVNSIGKTGSC